jgi:hypothetical protein
MQRLDVGWSGVCDNIEYAPLHRCGWWTNATDFCDGDPFMSFMIASRILYFLVVLGVVVGLVPIAMFLSETRWDVRRLLHDTQHGLLAVLGVMAWLAWFATFLVELSYPWWFNCATSDRWLTAWWYVASGFTAVLLIAFFLVLGCCLNSRVMTAYARVPQDVPSNGPAAADDLEQDRNDVTDYDGSSTSISRLRQGQ